MTSTLGIDLASQAKNTAACLLEWTDRGVSVTQLWHGAAPADREQLGDAGLVALMRGSRPGPRPAKVGIDAPLGWPAEFVTAVSDLTAWSAPLADVGQEAERRARLERRETDRWVRETTEQRGMAPKRPLSVTTDRIAYPAMRAAALLAHLARDHGEAIDRSGRTGLVCEVYPDPTIRCLGLWPGPLRDRASYKGGRPAAVALREGIAEPLFAVVNATPEQRRRCVEADDCLDAVICAIAARAAELGHTTVPPEHAQAAEREGWIHLPDVTLDQLV